MLGLTSNRRSEPSGPIPVAVDYRPPMYERMLGYTGYHGIMSNPQTAKRITDDDRNLTNAIYISHIAGAGW